MIDESELTYATACVLPELKQERAKKSWPPLLTNTDVFEAQRNALVRKYQKKKTNIRDLCTYCKLRNVIKLCQVQRPSGICI